jgi:hypothetical protein
MSHFSIRADHCRVDFFKPGGKWYATEEIGFGRLYPLSPNDALRTAINAQLPGRYTGMIAVCLEPYVQNSFPAMITVEV